MRYHTETGAPMCDVAKCENQATFNYQDAFIRWPIAEDGEYGTKNEMEIITAGDETNAHVCDDHNDSEYYG